MAEEMEREKAMVACNGKDTGHATLWPVIILESSSTLNLRITPLPPFSKWRKIWI